MSVHTIALRNQLIRLPVSYRERVSKMNDSELLVEFQAIRTIWADRELSLEEAADVQFLLERVLMIADTPTFQWELQKALGVLKSEMARVNN